jgi:hypothetical protein
LFPNSKDALPKLFIPPLQVSFVEGRNLPDKLPAPRPGMTKIISTIL